MKRIDVDDFVVVYIKWKEETHRWVIPTSMTVGVVARRVYEQSSGERRSQPTDSFSLRRSNAADPPLPVEAVVGRNMADSFTSYEVWTVVKLAKDQITR